MRIGIVGCGGRVGKMLLQELYYKNPNQLGSGLVRASSPLVGVDIGKLIGVDELGIKVTSDAVAVFSSSDVLVDFTNNNASIEYIKMAAEHHKPIVVGTTGFSDSQEALIKKLSEQTVIVKAANMSLGVNVLLKLVELAAATLKSEDYDIEILEKHHKHKKDSPSGTALTIGAVAAKARNNDLTNLYHSTRKGISAVGREEGKIGFSAIRGGDIVGEHSVFFIGEGESLELKHVATNRNIFVTGALKAAAWAVNKKSNGLYSFRDVVNND